MWFNSPENKVSYLPGLPAGTPRLMTSSQLHPTYSSSRGSLEGSHISIHRTTEWSEYTTAHWSVVVGIGGGIIKIRVYVAEIWAWLEISRPTWLKPQRWLWSPNPKPSTQIFERAEVTPVALMWSSQWKKNHQNWSLCYKDMSLTWDKSTDLT